MNTIPSAIKKERNWDLIREILINTVNGSLEEFKDEQSKISADAMFYNLKILIQGGYLSNIRYVPYIGGETIQRIGLAELTWIGNDLLDNIKDNSTWKQITKALANVGGTCSVEILKDLAISVVKGQLGLT